MTHSSLQGLHTLLEHHERARDEAIQRLQRAEAALANARLQTEQLQQYRADCDRRWTEQFRQGAAITLLQCHHQFSGRLQEAVGQQDRQQERLQTERQRRQAELLACEMKVASVRKLMTRRADTLREQADRREQKQFDERAARMAWQHQAELSAELP